MKDEDRIGFLSVAQVEDRAWVGAYLVTDLRGNPSRFYRSAAPVRVDRWQQILLGKALRRCVYVDLLGRPLVEQDGKVAALVVDCRELLDLRPFVEVPLGCLQDGRLVGHASYPGDASALEALSGKWDLIDGPAEVFERLRASINEPAKLDPAEE